MEPVWVVPIFLVLGWLLLGGALLALIAGVGLVSRGLFKRRIWWPGLRMFVLGVGLSAIGAGLAGLLTSSSPFAPGWPWLLVGIAGVILAFRIPLTGRTPDRR